MHAQPKTIWFFEIFIFYRPYGNGALGKSKNFGILTVTI
jgi:hypothetical protein